MNYILTSGRVFCGLETGLQVLVHKLWNVETFNLRGTSYTPQNLRETVQCHCTLRIKLKCLLQSEEETWHF